MKYNREGSKDDSGDKMSKEEFELCADGVVEMGIKEVERGRIECRRWNITSGRCRKMY